MSGVSSWDGSYEGGDIAAARRSYLGNSPIDIWGAFSGYFYGNLPDSILSWGAWLTGLHLFCSITGLFLIYIYIEKNNVIFYFYYLLLSYVLLVFSCTLTRDSTMTSLYIFGLGLIFSAKNRVRNHKVILFSAGTIAIIVSISFRPWLFFTTLIPIFFINAKIHKKLIFALFLMISPFVLDKLAYTTAEFNKVHPELQVITLDVAYMSCLSNDDVIRKEGTNLLNFISQSNYSNLDICENFRLNTWQSVGKWSITRQELGTIYDSNNVSKSKIILATSMSDEKYNQIRNKWIAYVLTNPKDYLQIKIIQFSQILVVGDTFGFRVFKELDQEIQILKLFLLPYDFLISFHLLSPLFTLFFGLMIISIRYRYLNLNFIFFKTNLHIAYLFLTIWTLITTVAYIGDNGRYLYLSTFVFHVLLILSLPKLENELLNQELFLNGNKS